MRSNIIFILLVLYALLFWYVASVYHAESVKYEDIIRNQEKEIQLLNFEIKEVYKVNDMLESQLEDLKTEQRETQSYLEKITNENSRLKHEVSELEKNQWISFNATAYTAKCNGCSGITATGKDIRDQSIDHRVVAVDPDIIPLGSIVEVEGYGQYLAADTGGAINGRKIDILHQSKEDAYQFGRRNVNVRILERG